MTYQPTPEALAAIDRADKERRMYCELLKEKWAKEAEAIKAEKLKKKRK